MSNNEKHENVIPDGQLDKVAGGYVRRPTGEKVKCKGCETMCWPSDLTGGYCGKCAEAIIKEGRVILI